MEGYIVGVVPCRRIVVSASSVTVNSLATDCGYTSWDSPFLYFGKLSGIH